MIFMIKISHCLLTKTTTTSRYLISSKSDWFRLNTWDRQLDRHHSWIMIENYWMKDWSQEWVCVFHNKMSRKQWTPIVLADSSQSALLPSHQRQTLLKRLHKMMMTSLPEHPQSIFDSAFFCLSQVFLLSMGCKNLQTWYWTRVWLYLSLLVIVRLWRRGPRNQVSVPPRYVKNSDRRIIRFSTELRIDIVLMEWSVVPMLNEVRRTEYSVHYYWLGIRSGWSWWQWDKTNKKMAWLDNVNWEDGYCQPKNKCRPCRNSTGE